METTPRPTLHTEGLTPNALVKQRQKAFERRRLSLLNLSEEDEHIYRQVLSTHRARQTRRLGRRDSDPDPYDSDYIFYCLETSRKD
jgi:hypothetical protein